MEYFPVLPSVYAYFHVASYPDSSFSTDGVPNGLNILSDWPSLTHLVCFGAICHNASVYPHLTKVQVLIFQQKEVNVVFSTGSKVKNKLVIPSLAPSCCLWFNDTTLSSQELNAAK